MIARVLSLIATVIFAISSVHAQTPAANSFVGTWKLIAADKLLLDGTRVADYGTQPHGLAIFTADGHFMVEVFRDVRVKELKGDILSWKVPARPDGSIPITVLRRIAVQ